MIRICSTLENKHKQVPSKSGIFSSLPDFVSCRNFNNNNNNSNNNGTWDLYYHSVTYR